MPHDSRSAPNPASTEKKSGIRAVPMDFTPQEVAERLRHLPDLIWMDSALAQPGKGAISILSASPTQVLKGQIDRDWDEVSALLAAHQTPAEEKAPHLPQGGLFGWVGYDGQFSLGLYPHLLAYDHDSRQWWEIGNRLSRAFTEPTPLHWTSGLKFTSTVSRRRFMAMVSRAREYIAAGDIYQVNLACPWSAPWPQGADPFALYSRLRKISPSPHAAYLHLDGTHVLSASPETFLKLDGQQILTRPIKGTRPRYLENAVMDTASAVELLASDKERAELLMITDLERNDLGQVCRFGSIQVPELWTLEPFAQVIHLVSTITGELRPEIDHAAAFRACFPGGSITGAPKKRAREIIAELESAPRGLYTGAIGWFGFNGHSQWNIAIRTAIQEESRIHFHVGSGIVADSDPAGEYQETLHKASGIFRAASVTE